MEKILRNLMAHTNPKRTICEVFREIFDMVYEMPDTMPEKKIIIGCLIEANGYAKKMSEKLHEYKANWDEEFYGPNLDHSEDAARRRVGRVL